MLTEQSSPFNGVYHRRYTETSYLALQHASEQAGRFIMAKVSTCLFFSSHNAGVLPEAEFSSAASAECFHIQSVDTTWWN